MHAIQYYELARPGPTIQLLDYNISYWINQGVTRIDDKGDPIQDAAGKVWALNHYVLKGRFFTLFGYITLARLRNGVSCILRTVNYEIPGPTVFPSQALDTGLEGLAMSEMRKQFGSSRRTSVNQPVLIFV